MVMRCFVERRALNELKAVYRVACNEREFHVFLKINGKCRLRYDAILLRSHLVSTMRRWRTRESRLMTAGATPNSCSSLSHSPAKQVAVAVTHQSERQRSFSLRINYILLTSFRCTIYAFNVAERKDKYCIRAHARSWCFGLDFVGSVFRVVVALCSGS